MASDFNCNLIRLIEYSSILRFLSFDNVGSFFIFFHFFFFFPLNWETLVEGKLIKLVGLQVTIGSF